MRLHIKSLFCLLCLLLLTGSATAGQKEFYQYNHAAGYAWMSASNGVPLTLEKAVFFRQSLHYGFYTGFTCDNWELYYNAGATPIAPGTLYATQRPNAITYAVPIHLSGCRLIFSDGPSPILMTDLYDYLEPISRVVCNPGYSAVGSYTITNCLPDSDELIAIHTLNEQGPPVTCDACVEPWLAEQAPGSISPSLQRGDPVNVANGNEFLSEVDYQGSGSNSLDFIRYYNSGTGFTSNLMGTNWTHNYSYRAEVPTRDGNTIILIRPNGASVVFIKNGSNNSYTGPSYFQGKLTGVFSAGNLSSFTLTLPDGTSESYVSNGMLSTITTPSNGTLTFAIIADSVLSVTDNRGHSLKFSYINTLGGKRLSQLITQSGTLYKYGYDALGRLISVTFPDGAIRQYQYLPATINGAANLLSNRLTAIVDENNQSYATLTYDTGGRVSSTQHGTGVELTSFVYSPFGTTVTHSLGVKETFQYASLASRPMTSSVVTSCTDGCGDSLTMTDKFQRDGNGNISAIVNKQGIKTCISYDIARNLPLKVVDNLSADMACDVALATPPATSRVKSYQWHATLYRPLVVTGPLLKTIYTYDAYGRMLTQTEQETTDALGAQGVSASIVGAARVTTRTYNSQGSLLTIKSPRTDVNSTATFTYDTNQNLTTSTSPTGLVTTFGNYNADGRPQLIMAPNGLQTTLSYTTRGNLATISVGGATTLYTYDAAGQLIGSSLPSGISLTYTYDAAHRLTAILDSLGNQKTYLLDSEGNVLQETILGSGNALAYSHQVAYDQLSRATLFTPAQ